MELREALIKQAPSLALQRAAAAEIARLDALVVSLALRLDDNLASQLIREIDRVRAEGGAGIHTRAAVMGLQPATGR